MVKSGPRAGPADGCSRGGVTDSEDPGHEDRIAATLDAALDCIITIDHTGTIIAFNAAAEGTFGYSRADAIGRRMVDLIVPPSLRGQHIEGFARYLATGEPHVIGRRIEIAAVRADGVEFPVELAITRIQGHEPPLFTGFLRDITERKRAEEEIRRLNSDLERRVGERTLELEAASAELRGSEARFRAMVQNASDLILIVGEGGVIRYVSPSVERLLGYRAEDLTDLDGSNHYEVAGVVTELTAALQGPGSHPAADLRVRHRDGSWRYLQAVGTNLSDDPSVGGVLITARDITERMDAEEVIRRLAYYDPLTRLPNRAMFTERLVDALARARATRKRLAVIHIGLDGFKLVNDSLGHAVGDGFLSSVGALLRRHLPEPDLLARFGGDEFIVLVDSISGPEKATLEAERLLALLRQPFVMDGGPRFLEASAGVAISGLRQDETSGDTLLQAAEAALHKAKLAGRGRAVVFDPDMTASARARLDLETDLRQALARDELRLYYQPLVALGSGAIRGVEALVRWQHPRRGMLLPGAFIHHAEEMGLILSIGRWVLETACRQARDWQVLRAGRSAFSVSVNLSVRELLQPGLADQVADILRATELEPGNIKLEVTESAIMQDTEFGIATLHALRAIGVRLAIDDFGTGYSSLSHLRRFPVDTLKIDHSFVRELDQDLRAPAIVGAIIELAHALGMDVTAEGVETAAQSAWLHKMQCERCQGFFYYEPMPAEAVTEILRAERSAVRSARRISVSGRSVPAP